MKFSISLLLALSLLAYSATAQRLVRRRQRRPSRVTGRSMECAGTVDFELITGFVYSSADDIIESNIGALQMSECLEQCKKNAECLALNFETGLCVLFRTAAGEDSESLSVSQFPVFTLYAQKICTQSVRPKTCRSPWSYETVPELGVKADTVTETVPAGSRSDCATLCLSHERFTCRSAAYNRETKECKMTQMDRNMAGRKTFVMTDSKYDYVEMACATKPDRMCEFQSVRGKIMKTVDAVYLDTKTTQECREKCLAADFGCYSYDFMSAGEPICRLSHHSSATLAHIQEPYLPIDNATTYELQACYHVSIECKASEMVAMIATSTVFNGKVYARARPNSCVEDITNSTEFNITLPYNSLECDVRQDGNAQFASDIVIQHHDMIVTRADVGFALHCKYELKNHTVTQSLNTGIEVKSDPSSQYIQEVVVASPNVTMRVTNGLGNDIQAAQVGDDLALRFEIVDRNSPYEIFVRELVALDGRDGSEITLIDEYGCPTDVSIMQNIVQVGNGKTLLAPFQAFKFPTTDEVQFRALLTPCHNRCEPAECVSQGFDGTLLSTTSFGRRKRRSIEEGDPSDIMVAQSIQITDKFLFEAGEGDAVSKELALEECASSFTGLVIASALFILAQVVVLMTWSYQWHKKRATKQLSPHYPPITQTQWRPGSHPPSRASSTAYLTR